MCDSNKNFLPQRGIMRTWRFISWRHASMPSPTISQIPISLKVTARLTRWCRPLAILVLLMVNKMLIVTITQITRQAVQRVLPRASCPRQIAPQALQRVGTHCLTTLQAQLLTHPLKVAWRLHLAAKGHLNLPQQCLDFI